jgi:hypothetical protein
MAQWFAVQCYTLRNDQKFNIEFIATVERYPVIYDYRMSGYSKKARRKVLDRDS